MTKIKINIYPLQCYAQTVCAKSIVVKCSCGEDVYFYADNYCKGPTVTICKCGIYHKFPTNYLTTNKNQL